VGFSCGILIVSVCRCGNVFCLSACLFAFPSHFSGHSLIAITVCLSVLAPKKLHKVKLNSILRISTECSAGKWLDKKH